MGEQQGVQFDPQQRGQLEPEAVRQAALDQYLQRVAAEAQQRGASRLHHYFVVVRPECLTPAGYVRPAYLDEVRERHRWRGLTELRTGVHWGEEERGRLDGRPRSERTCPHCAARGGHAPVEDTWHICFECTL